MPLVQSSAVDPVAPVWLDELTLRSEPPWLTMGARALREAPFATSGHDRDVRRDRKEDLLRAVHDEASVILAGANTVADEAAQLVSRVTGRQLEAGWPPLEAAALLVPEDLVVLVRLDGEWRMAAGVGGVLLALVSDGKTGGCPWSPSTARPRYADELSHRVDRFLDQLNPGRAVWRRKVDHRRQS